MTAPRMLSEPHDLDEAMARGVEVDEPDEAEVLIFDSTYRFAKFRVRDGVACEVVSGPYEPDHR